MKIFNWINKIPSGGEKQPMVSGHINQSGGTFQFYLNKTTPFGSGTTVTVPVDENGYFEWNNEEGINITSLCGMFLNLRNLIEVSFGKEFDTSNVTTMESMFQYCSALTTLNIKDLNTINVTTFYDMFGACSALRSVDLSGWNTNNVANIAYMFVNLSSLTYLKLDNWTTTQITDSSKYNAFVYNSSNLTIDYKPSKWNSSIPAAFSNVNWNSVE